MNTLLCRCGNLPSALNSQVTTQGKKNLHIQQSKRKSENRAFGTSNDHRFEEALQIFLPLLRTGQIDFEGRYYQAQDCELRPHGLRPADPDHREGPLRQSEEITRCGRQAMSPVPRWNAIPPSWAVVLPLRSISRRHKTRMGSTRRHGVSSRSWPHLTRSSKCPTVTCEGLNHVQIWLSPSTIAGQKWLAAVLDLLNHSEAGFQVIKEGAQNEAWAAH